MKTMKLFNDIKVLAIIVLFGALIISQLTKKTEIKKEYVTVPEVSGSFTDTVEVVRVDTVIIKEDLSYEASPGVVNENKLDSFIQEKDSVKKTQMYADAVTNNDFSKIFEDDHIKLEVTGETEGILRHIEVSYNIKSQKIEVKRKDFLQAGFGVMLNMNGKIALGPTINIKISPKSRIQISPFFNSGLVAVCLTYTFSIF